MRYKKRSLIARRNKVLPIKFVRKDMTTYSGLTLIGHYLRIYRIHHRLKKSMKAYDFKGDYSIGDILFMLLMMMILVSAERLQHIEYLKGDPLFCRTIRLTRIPHRTKLSTALKQFASDSLKALIELNSQLVVEKLLELGFSDITIDLDGTVISSRGNPFWSFKDYNPIKRGANSYFPLTAHIGETGHFLTIFNRPGNVHDSNRALSVIKTIRKQLSLFCIRFRADSALRTRIHKTMEWKTFKFIILNRAGRINKDGGKKVLEMTSNPTTESLYEKIVASLEYLKFKKAA